MFGNFGIQNRVNADALGQPGFVSDFPFVASPWQTGVGDLKLGLKYKILDDYLGDAVGLALRGYVKIPTADERKGLGTGKVSSGGNLILSRSLGKVVDLHGSIGYEFNQDPEGIEIGNAFKWGFGVNFPCCSFFQFQAEVTGASYSGADFEQTNPVDFVMGPFIWIKPGLFIRPALSWNQAFDGRGLDSSFQSYAGRHISIGYHPGTACREVVTARPLPPPPANRPPTVVCEPGASVAPAGETVSLRAVASDPDGDTLSYAWNASAGNLTPLGAQATLDLAGVVAPATIRVTVDVSDGRRATAQAVCSVQLETARARQAETVRCVSSGFPPNLARLNNVDKACLDDVASRLKLDPRSRVIVVGHADASERHPEVLGRTRAEAASDYLVRERGVEAARVSVRSAAATQPLAAGAGSAARSRNRRVEIMFLPPGATAPES
jgi:outer membrane protein OmpA-like peptidoglycan-associated protein